MTDKIDLDELLAEAMGEALDLKHMIAGFMVPEEPWPVDPVVTPETDAKMQWVREFMNENGLEDWGLVLESNPFDLGRTSYTHREIRLSKQVVDANDLSTVKWIARHEAAHALLGEEESFKGEGGHTRLWADKARELGDPDPRATLDVGDIGTRIQTTVPLTFFTRGEEFDADLMYHRHFEEAKDTAIRSYV
jgi:hypothetical protein